MLVDREAKAAKPLLTPCSVCKRDTYHLLGNCTWHSNWKPPILATPEDLLLRDQVRRVKAERESRKAANQEQEEIDQRRTKWLGTQGTKHGKKVYRKRIPLDPGLILCNRCWKPMEIVKASYGKLSSVSYAKVVEQEHYLTPGKTVLTVETVKKRAFPTTTRIHICPSCVERLLEYVHLEQLAWHDDPNPEKGEFRPSFIPEIEVTDHGRMPPGFGLDKLPSNRRSGRWKTWSKI